MFKHAWNYNEKQMPAHQPVSPGNVRDAQEYIEPQWKTMPLRHPVRHRNVRGVHE
jgi:hypothetical protein